MNKKIVFRLIFVFISIMFASLLIDFIHVYDLMSELENVPGEAWHIFSFMIWFYAVIDLFKNFSVVNKWLSRIFLAIILWLSSTLVLIVIWLSFHVKMGWPL